MRIGVVAPARGIDEALASRALGLAAVAMPEVDLVFHPQCFLSDGHFAGSDAVRAAAFVEVANDPAFDAIWFARGGYGSNRILHSVMPQLGAAARHKTYLGFSDMGFLLGALYAAKVGHPVHGPMASVAGSGDGGAGAPRSAMFAAIAWCRSGWPKRLAQRPVGRRHWRRAERRACRAAAVARAARGAAGTER